MTRFLTTLAAVALSAVAARAEPIRWKLSTPAVTRVIPDVGTFHISAREYVSNPLYQKLGLPEELHFSQWLGPVDYRSNFGPTRVFDSYYSVATLFDLASGESGQFNVPMYIATSWSGWSFEGREAWFDTRLVLGGNEYRIKSDGRVRSVDTSYYAVPAELTVKPLAETPEPATVLLAGVGLAGMGLVRRLRRQAA